MKILNHWAAREVALVYFVVSLVREHHWPHGFCVGMWPWQVAELLLEQW